MKKVIWSYGKTIMLFFGFSIIYGFYKIMGITDSIILVGFIILFGLLGYLIKTKIFKKK